MHARFFSQLVCTKNLAWANVESATADMLVGFVSERAREELYPSRWKMADGLSTVVQY